MLVFTNQDPPDEGTESRKEKTTGRKEQQEKERMKGRKRKVELSLVQVDIFELSWFF